MSLRILILNVIVGIRPFGNFELVMAPKSMLYCMIDIVYFGLKYFNSKTRLIYKDCVYMV